ncbi:Gfo/Idh/MocA family oxidoreductase [Paenibacillus hemerocallicola]|uniref:Gfo/Idh/MocA family oxidoreductase n=1 Tax=Paenibacillus hemerocallicola TaxID=1172614 RepID=A0A5C4SWA5_9BACL|nr:Gfo/Idh/MocA family oxidoreductase [Paenibacillus hemerocallicola]TNJ55923.1 Gfo/Idh/MocA family oxidoreductase [Paenibacillus hemerocallicola]
MSVKLGMIGAGGIAKSHMNALKKVERAKIVSIFDLNTEGAEQAAASVGAKVAESADALLNPAEIDAVFICVPQFARGDLEEIAAKRGIHVFVEKPLGLELELVARKEQAVREAGILNSVGYVLRYYDTVQKAKQYLQGKTIHLIQGFRIGGSHPAPWWSQQHMSNGNLGDAVTHQIDMIRYLAGEYKEVTAQFGRNTIKTLKPEATIPDAGAVTFSMESGAVGTITESCLSSFHSGSEIKFIGQDFFLQLTGNGKTLTIIDNTQNVTITSKQDPVYEQDNAFVEAVAAGSGDSILCGYADGMRTLAFTIAAYQAAEERGTVKV